MNNKLSIKRDSVDEIDVNAKVTNDANGRVYFTITAGPFDNQGIADRTLKAALQRMCFDKYNTATPTLV